MAERTFGSVEEIKRHFFPNLYEKEKRADDDYRHPECRAHGFGITCPLCAGDSKGGGER